MFNHSHKLQFLITATTYYLSKENRIESNSNYKLKGVFIMSKKGERFEKIYSQGAINVIEIWVDKETGVNYIYRQSGYSGGMTVLLDSEGKPVITKE